MAGMNAHSTRTITPPLVGSRSTPLTSRSPVVCRTASPAGPGRYGYTWRMAGPRSGDVAVHRERGTDDGRDEGPQQQDGDAAPGRQQVHVVGRRAVAGGVHDRCGRGTGH